MLKKAILINGTLFFLCLPVATVASAAAVGGLSVLLAACSPLIVFASCLLIGGKAANFVLTFFDPDPDSSSSKDDSITKEFASYFILTTLFSMLAVVLVIPVALISAVVLPPLLFIAATAIFCSSSMEKISAFLGVNQELAPPSSKGEENNTSDPKDETLYAGMAAMLTRLGSNLVKNSKDTPSTVVESKSDDKERSTQQPKAKQINPSSTSPNFFDKTARSSAIPQKSNLRLQSATTSVRTN